METNKMLELARETRKKIRGVFGERVDTIAGYDFVDEPNHQTFKLDFKDMITILLNFIMKMTCVNFL